PEGPGSELYIGGTSFQDPYSPANYGYYYTLTTTDGTQYKIDAASGRIDSVHDRAGNTITYSDSAISGQGPDGSSLGQITINRDTSPGDTFNNILSIQVAPNGDKNVYTYAPHDVTGQYAHG